MADSAQANWNAVRIVYGSGDPKVPIERHERICYFHWTQSLEKHTKQYVKHDLQDQHKRLCFHSTMHNPWTRLRKGILLSRLGGCRPIAPPMMALDTSTSG